jgi:glycine cleavage system aminomethyltransferase T/glycine/D-amino acid oxidase-like deaminating enzyme
VTEALLDDGITAAAFSPGAATDAVPSGARVVVIGGGVIGTSTALHLAELGITDVVLLERAAIAAGTSWHAAGLLARVRGSHAMTELANYGVDRYARLEADSGVPVGFFANGSLTLARNEGRLAECRATAAIARHHGVEARMVSPDQVVEIWPLASKDHLLGGLHQPGDATVNPGHAALAFAKLAHDKGVAVRERVRVTGLRVADGAVTAVESDRGTIETETVVLCAGMWTRDLAASVGAHVPLYAAEHVHVTTAPVEGAVRTLPILRDLDGYLYVRHYRGRLVVGAFEPNGKPRAMDTIEDGFAFGEFGPDWDHFRPVRENAERAVPALRDVEYERYLRAPESFTPDANFCLGETPEVRGLFVGAGFNSQGIIYAPGAGRALAEWVHEGAPTFDAAGVEVGRFARAQSVGRYLHERTREGLGRLYAMHWPHLQPETARDVRRTPLYDRVKAANACFGEAAGWERANWYAPDGVEARYDYSFARQNWFPYVAQEHRAAREAVALFDLSSFAKVEMAGADALTVLQRVCTANVDVEVGRVVYTLLLNHLGGIELDGTVTRLDEDRFLVLTPTMYQHKTVHWLRRHVGAGEHAAVFDATGGMATLAVMGPRSRELLQRVSPADLTNDAFRWGRAKEIEVADAYALALRMSFVGELGWELYVPSESAVNVYDAIVRAGDDLGLRHAGYHALDSLRLEKGYRHLGHDVGPADTPWQARLGHVLAMDKGDFVGRDALAAKAAEPQARLQVFVRLEDPEPLLLHGESVLHDGRICGQVTSGGFGHTVGASVGLGYVDAEAFASAEEGAAFMVDVLGETAPAVVSPTPFYDPGNERLRS